MLSTNTRQVNRIISTCLAWCSLLLIALLATSWLGYFDFDDMVKGILVGLGFFACIVPTILYKLQVSDNFLKYYMLIAMSLLICLLGTNNGIGIYITYALVPIVSGLYFDRIFTLFISAFSYVTMALGVYVNSAGKLEVVYKGWSHWITFRDYMIGFTFEYIIVMIFVYQMVKRSQNFLEAQQESLKDLRKENDRQKEIFEYYNADLSEQKRTALARISKESAAFTQEDFNRLATGHQFNAQLIETMRLSNTPEEGVQAALEMIGEYFGIDRILYMEPSLEAETNDLSYQWARNGEELFPKHVAEVSKSEIKDITKVFDEDGYIELYKNYFTVVDEKRIKESQFIRHLQQTILGAQLWLPGIFEGKYNAAVCFERKDLSSYTAIDKMLLAEVANSLTLFVSQMNADRANSAKSAFLSNMSHEIRTPMNAILGMTTVSLREEMNDTVRKNLNIIRSSSEGLLAIINDILDFSKIESGRIDIVNENYNPLSLFNDVTTLINARNVEKGLTITYHVAEDFPALIDGDLVRIKQVMVNLGTNAIKYTDEGEIDIEISYGWEDSETIMLEYKVSDTGQGIREEDLGLLFQDYSQMNQKQNHHKEGTGLGLAISKKLAELMGGKISVESAYGQGSTFTFTVPQRVIDESPAGALANFEITEITAADVADYKAPGVKVLIVDDNEINVMVAEALFRPFEMDVKTAMSGVEALELLQKETFDIIFMDHYMPEMDGTEVARKIRAMEDNPNSKATIVALTADAISGARERMLEAGMDDFLSKPISLQATVKILIKYLK